MALWPRVSGESRGNKEWQDPPTPTGGLRAGNKEIVRVREARGRAAGGGIMKSTSDMLHPKKDTPRTGFDLLFFDYR